MRLNSLLYVNNDPNYIIQLHAFKHHYYKTNVSVMKFQGTEFFSFASVASRFSFPEWVTIGYVAVSNNIESLRNSCGSAAV